MQLLISLVSTPISSSPPISEVNGGSGGGRGVAVLISTPYMDEAARCNRVGFMRHGKIIAEGTPSELRSCLKDRIVELNGEPIKRFVISLKRMKMWKTWVPSATDCIYRQGR